MPLFVRMARVEAKLASEAKEKGKLRNEPVDRSTRYFRGHGATIWGSSPQMRLPETWSASCVSRTNEVLD